MSEPRYWQEDNELEELVAPAVTKAADAAVRSRRLKVSAMYRLLILRADPNQFNNRPIKTRFMLL
jgi:hypothetical protein